MKHWTARLTLGETWNVPTVVTSFGKPLRDAEVRLQSIKRSYPHVTCHKKVCMAYYFQSFIFRYFLMNFVSFSDIPLKMEMILPANDISIFA